MLHEITSVRCWNSAWDISICKGSLNKLKENKKQEKGKISLIALRDHSGNKVVRKSALSSVLTAHKRAL